MKIIKIQCMSVLMITIISIILLSSCGGSSNNGVKSENNSDTEKIILREEMPPLKTNHIVLGKIKMNQDGYSIGKKTELTELQNQLKINEYDIIEIVWVWDCSPKYDDMPMKIVYDKGKGNLKLIYTKSNVIEEYSNILSECLTEFLKNGEKSFYSLENYCKDANYDFNNREMTTNAVGTQPEQSEWDGSVKIVKDYLKVNANDASSIKFVEWSKVSPFGEFWIVRCKYKGTNTFGSIVTENMWFYIQNSQVVKTKNINEQ